MSRFTDELSCAAAREMLDDYLDGAVAEDVGRRLERHVAACGGCAAELRLAEDVLRELRALPELDCPPRVIERAARLAGMAVAAEPAARRRTALEAGSPAENRLAASRPKAPSASSTALPPLVPGAPAAPSAPWALQAPAARTAPRRGRGSWQRSLAGAAALLLLALTAVLAGSSAPRPVGAEVVRGEAQARFALAYIARVSDRAGWRVRRQVLARRVVAPLTKNVSQSLFEALGERRDAAQSAAQALRREARKET
jgi:hypothetical protein